jgi:hypothetical protein
MLAGFGGKRPYLQNEDHAGQNSEEGSNGGVSETAFRDEALQNCLQDFARGIDDFLDIMLIDTVELIQRLEPAVAIRRPRSWLSILCRIITLGGLIGHGRPSIDDRLQGEGIDIETYSCIR